MPEITSVQRIRDKLRDFDEMVSGAIQAAQRLKAIQGQATQILSDIQSLNAKCEVSLEHIEGLREDLAGISEQWGVLEKTILNAREELRGAIDQLEDRVRDAGEQLSQRNAESLAVQAETLGQLDSSTRQNADIAANAKTVVEETASRLDKLLLELRDDMHEEIRILTAKAEKQISHETSNAREYLEQEHVSLKTVAEANAKKQEEALQVLIANFKSEMQNSLEQHQQGVERKITDFLNQQNALVQNLAQQIDGFIRLTQTLQGDNQVMAGKLAELTSTHDRLKTTMEHAAKELQAQRDRDQDTLQKLMNTLKTVPLIKGYFKDL